MKKGQKQLYKLINRTFKNAIILQQLRIDELKLVERREIWLQERQGAKVASEQKFPSGGVIGVGFGKSKNEEGVSMRRHLIAKFPKKDCNCNACRIEREILKHANKNDV